MGVTEVAAKILIDHKDILSFSNEERNKVKS